MTHSPTSMYRIKNIHFIGIGGSGMSGIAEVLLNQGYGISGSDLAANTSTERLVKLGAKVFFGHNSENIVGADAVVISSAIGKNNAELVAARKLRLPVLSRAQMLAELMRFHHGIAVSGTHGKTTTTSLIASVLAEGKLDPTFVIGGLLNSAGANARLGSSCYFVVEADESDASFLHLSPTMSVVTNIDADHLQTYQNDFQKLQQTFLDFLHNLPFYGLAVVCIDDPTIKKILPKIARPIITYGFTEDADICAADVEQKGMCTYFKVYAKNNPKPLKVKLNLAGRHNVLNSLAAIAVARELKIQDKIILQALANFKGVGRRLQSYGELTLANGPVTIFDDYGHHPHEISVSLTSLRAAWPKKRLVLAFQPHRYTRTQALFDDFAIALSKVDALLLLDVYAAGEKPITGVNSATLAEQIRKSGAINPILVRKCEDLPEVLNQVLQTNDLLLLQGAGNIGSVAPRLAQLYNKK